MKLSDIKGERTLDVIAEVIEPIANIAEDEKAAALFKREKLPEGENAVAYLLKRIKSHLPALLKGHKHDLITIFAAIEGVSYDEYAASLNLGKLTKDLLELMTDEAFGGLFISAQSGISSGSAQENTEGAKA